MYLLSFFGLVALEAILQIGCKVNILNYLNQVFTNFLNPPKHSFFKQN